MKTWGLPVMIALFVSIVWLVTSVVGNRYKARMLYTEFHALEKERDELNSVWSRLRLEQSTILNHSRIERRARDNLNMKMPDAIDLKVIRE